MRALLMLPLLTALFTPAPGHAQSQPSWMIMKPEPGRPQEVPEPWLPPKYKSPRGSRQHVRPLKHPRAPETRRFSEPPPPVVVPQTGQTLPNMPTVAPSGPRGTETFQDKALRCTHQAGVYGARAGDPGAYVGTCVNQ